MDAALLLQKITKLDEVKTFISLLEIKFLQEEQKLSQLKIAKNLLDKILIYLAFNLEKKLQNAAQNQPAKNEIFAEILAAANYLKIFEDESLNLEMLGLADFFKTAFDGKILTAKNPQDLDDLRAKILLITSARFG